MCHERWKPAGPGTGSAPQDVTFAVGDGSEMPAWRYAADAALGACLVLPDIYGVSPFYHEVAARVATAGYHATLADYFFRQGAIAELTREAAFARRSTMDENLCLRDLSDVVGQVRAETSSRRVGIIGFCLSGTYALDLAAMRDDLATVSFYGFPEGPGGPVASVAPKPIEVADRLAGPIVAFWGDQDHIPVELIERFGATVRRHDAEYVQHVYPGAGHGFLQGLVEEREDSNAARDAWRRALEFLDRNVPTPHQ